MTFLAPAALAGLAAVAAPIAIHFLNKMRVKVVRWGATRFLLESLKKNQRRLEIEDLLLLVLRCLILILLALAFALPVFNPDGGSGGGAGDEPSVSVILLDQSASMAQSDGVHTRFDQARDVARERIEGLGEGSQVALFLVSDAVNQVVPRPTENLPLVRRALDLAEVTDRTSDLAPAVRVAIDALRSFPGSRQEIVVLTDNQAAAWREIDTLEPILAEAPDVELRIVPVGGEGEDNLAVTSMRPESRVAAAGQLFSAIVEVSNFGKETARGVRVSLMPDADPPADESVIASIEPGQSATVRLGTRFTTAGPHTLVATISSDRLPVDDSRALAVQVIDRMNVMIVEGTRKQNKADRDAYFLLNALLPIAPTRVADYFLRAEVGTVSLIEDSDLSQFDAIILSNVGRIVDGAATKLRDYVRGGGGLIAFPGTEVRPDAWNDDPILGELWPAKLGPFRDLKGDSLLSWEARGHTHPVTALWNDPDNGSLGTVSAGKYFPLTLVVPKDDTEAPTALVRYTDGTPAAAIWSYGKGRVALFSSSATTEWNNLPIHPAFVPLMRRMGDAVARQGVAPVATISPGVPFREVVTPDLVGREFVVVRPDSENGEARPAGQVEIVNRQAVVSYRDTERAGAYRLLPTGEPRALAAFAVQVDAEESDLRTISPDLLSAFDGDQPVGDSADPESSEGRAVTAGVRREFWGLLVSLAAVVAVVQMALAHKFSRAR